jgi:AcrR family transcriptional regulator
VQKVAGRRTQAERREQTRTALLDATVSCLVDLGFSGTTTTEVTRRAGVSLGALLHYFPAKADLLVAAVGHVLERRQAEFRESMAGLDPGVDRVDAAIDLLWSAFTGPTFTAWVELWVASRTDPDLAAEMVVVDERFLEDSEALFREFFPQLAMPDGLAVLPFVFAVMDGLALQRLVPHGDNGRAAFDTFKAVARRLLADVAPDRQEN